MNVFLPAFIACSGTHFFILLKFLPPPKWRFPVLISAGIFVGLGLFTVYLSKAPSYLSDNPETCVNCHIMSPQYATWNHSSHRAVANCIDCHVQSRA